MGKNQWRIDKVIVSICDGKTESEKKWTSEAYSNIEENCENIPWQFCIRKMFIITVNYYHQNKVSVLSLQQNFRGKNNKTKQTFRIENK